MLEAAEHFDYQLPEVFAGLPRAETPFPIAYPTAARPQAWAAGTPVLLLQVLLGLEPDRSAHRLETPRRASCRPGPATLRLTGVRAFDRTWDVRVEDGRVTVEESDEDRRPRAGPGSPSRRRATAGSSGSSRCSPTGSPTRATR